MARWYALGLQGKPLGPEFEALDRISATAIAEHLHPSSGGGWKVKSVLEYEDEQREAEAKARADARKLRWSPA